MTLKRHTLPARRASDQARYYSRLVLLTLALALASGLWALWTSSPHIRALLILIAITLLGAAWALNGLAYRWRIRARERLMDFLASTIHDAFRKGPAQKDSSHD